MSVIQSPCCPLRLPEHIVDTGHQLLNTLINRPHMGVLSKPYKSPLEARQYPELRSRPRGGSWDVVTADFWAWSPTKRILKFASRPGTPGSRQGRGSFKEGPRVPGEPQLGLHDPHRRDPGRGRHPRRRRGLGRGRPRVLSFQRIFWYGPLPSKRDGKYGPSVVGGL